MMGRSTSINNLLYVYVNKMDLFQSNGEYWTSTEAVSGFPVLTALVLLRLQHAAS